MDLIPVKYVKRSNGDQYPVRYDVNAFCHFEEMTGKSLVNGAVGFDVRSIRALVFVGLTCGHEFEKQPFKLTPLDIGRWNDLIKVIFPQCLAALKEMSPQEEGDGGEETPGER